VCFKDEVEYLDIDTIDPCRDIGFALGRKAGSFEKRPSACDQRIRMQTLLGAKEARPEAIHVARTHDELTPKTYELRGDPELFDTWARIIDHTIHHMSEDEFAILVSKVDEARILAARHRHERSPAPEPATWHVLDVDGSEVAVRRGCALNLT